MSTFLSDDSDSEATHSMNTSRQDRENFVHDLAQAIGAVMPQQRNERSLVVSQFCQMGPPKLKGKEGPLATEEWIFELERIFEHLNCTDTERVSCAVFQLTEDAGHWWQSQKLLMTSERREKLTWEEFKIMVMGKFFPKAYRKQKETKLMNLEQGEMTILEYERAFNRLSRYAPQLVATEEDKIWRFEYGLRPEIGGILAGQVVTNSFTEIVERAQAVAMRLNLEKPESKCTNVGSKRRWDDRD